MSQVGANVVLVVVWDGGILLALLRAGYIALPGGPMGNVLTFAPPFGIEEEDLRGALEVVEGAGK